MQILHKSTVILAVTALCLGCGGESATESQQESKPTGQTTEKEPAEETPGFGQAIKAARQKDREAQQRLEIDMLQMALKEYRAQYGEFPPDYSDSAAVERHIRRVFPRFDPEKSTLPPSDLDPAQALVFWLSGFSPDPRNPFREDGPRDAPLIDFEKDRLEDGRYIAAAGEKPYVYFHSATYETVSYQGLHPYKLDEGGYAEPRQFQIISAGLDGDYGTGGSYPSGEGFAPGDYDNMASFSGSPLGEATP